MPNRTLYINNDNWAKFKDEPAMSELVNVLLMNHYKKFQGEDLKDLREDVKKLKKELKIKTADEIAIDAFAGKQLTCPAGHPSKDGRHCNNLKCAYGG